MVAYGEWISDSEYGESDEHGGVKTHVHGIPEWKFAIDLRMDLKMAVE